MYKTTKIFKLLSNIDIQKGLLELKTNAFKIYMYIVLFTDGTFVFSSLDISDKTGLSKNAIAGGIRELVEKGYIELI